MTFEQVTQVRAAVHGLNGAHTVISLAARLAVEGAYTMEELAEAIRTAGERSKAANKMFEDALGGEPGPVLRPCTPVSYDANGSEAVP